MKELDESKIYDLSDLKSDELNYVLEYAQQNNPNHSYRKTLSWLKSYIEKGYKFIYLEENGWGFEWITEGYVNAKELFYTLENVQVDCSELTQDQIKEMASIFEKNGYPVWNNANALDIENGVFLMVGLDNEVYLNNGFNSKTTITYEKFMELFGNKEKSQEFKNLVEVLNEELTEEYNNLQFKQIANSLADLLEYKNNMYGNSALEPLNIFNNKTKVGQRIDDKLARVKNSTELRKNDIVDILGYLMLVCKENNWTNFDEFKD